MKLAHLLIALLILGSFCLAENPPGTVKQIAPGVWFRQGDTRGGTGISNNIIIEMKDYLVIVDANYPSGARLVIDLAKTLSPKPIRWVINTHHHPDHSYGNRFFTQAGATTIAYIGAYEEMERYEPQTWQQVSKERQDVRELNLAAPEPPMLLYTTSPYVITDGARRVELHHFMFGHTRGDTFVYLPKEKILCTGDAVVNGPYSDPKNAYMGNWSNEIRAAQQLDVEYVLPGHGDPGGKELLEGEIRFFDALYKAVEAEVKNGKKLEQLVTMGPNGRPVATTIRLPKSIQDVYVFKPSPTLPRYAVFRFPTQVMATYEEITHGKPYADVALAAGKPPE
jgi:glyoxylase-like metal-dependent hydrolase (beta-lactamase superfamily II)